VPVDLNGDDPVAYVVSLNARRRNTRVGMLAVAAARAWPLYEVEKGRPKEVARGRATFGKTSKRLSAVFGVGVTAVEQAHALVERDPPAAETVASGAISLTAAYEVLRERERAAESQAVKLARVSRRGRACPRA
jgi:hypothetical protein